MTMSTQRWVVLTQDRAGADGWLPALQAAGLSVHRWPAFRVEAAVQDSTALHALFPPRSAERICYTCTPLMPASRRVEPEPLQAAHAGIYVLPSPAAVRVLADWLDAEQRRWPLEVWAGVPGQGTAQVFRQLFGPRIRLIVPPPPMHDGEHLAAEILRVLGLEQGGGQLSAVPQLHLFNRPDGRTAWLERLQQAGVQTAVLPIYRVCPEPRPPAQWAEALAAHRQAQERLDWLIGATEPLQTVAEWLSTLPSPLGQWAREQPVWLPHQRLVPLARQCGFERVQVYHDRQQLIEQLQWEPV